MSDAASEKLILILGSGPGIGVGVASHFASQSFGRVALISRNAERLKEDAETVKADSGKKDLQVKVYAVDVGNVLALEKTLGQVAHDLGPPEVVVYNAARLRQSKFGDVPAKELTEDFQVCFIFPAYGRRDLGIRAYLTLTYTKVAISGLYTTAMWAMPHLSALAANVRKDVHPSFLVTGGGLYKNPVPQFFALAMMKAAQVNLAGSLAKEYGPNGVHVGTVAVGGYVSPDSDVFSPAKIAETFWKLYKQEKDQWELIVHLGC
jgi:NAD(P)-dependent dehydrogenase (short-subunit alcohol dehydrogenase family)